MSQCSEKDSVWEVTGVRVTLPPAQK